MVLSAPDASSVIRAAVIQLRQNNNVPASSDGQQRRGGDSSKVSGHRLKVERQRRTLTFSSHLFIHGPERPGDATSTYALQVFL